GVRSILAFARWQRARDGGDDASAAVAYDELQAHFPDSNAAAYARAEVEPSQLLSVGHEMPTWRFPNLDRPRAPTSATRMSGSAARQATASGRSRVLASANLKGRPYLFHVWATWCGVCRAEMKGLHEAYDEINGVEGDGAPAKAPVLEFVSLLSDEPESGRSFREEAWPLPWLNGYLPLERQEELAREWGLQSFPTLVLVNAQGQIVAAGEDLRGGALAPTLRAFVAAARP